MDPTSSETAKTSPRRQRVGLTPETLGASIVFVLLVNVVQRSVGFGRAVLFCRWLDPDQLGLWEMSFGFLMLAAPLAVLGLPGSFGRYLEKHRQEGRLGLFLRRTATWTFALASTTIALLLWNRDAVALLVFGDASRGGLAAGVITCLAIVIVHHFFEAIFAGLRAFRVVSAMHFMQSMGFAVISLSLLAWWRAEAASLVVGYAAACLVSLIGVSIWAFIRLERTPDAGGTLGHRDFWPPLMRFAIWIWVTNLLTNVFTVVDRYMILHCGVFTNEMAIEQVGNYHTSTIVPMLLVSMANLLVGALTPHLSHDWEAGRRDLVSSRLNLGLKLTTLSMLVAGVGALLFCPLMFHFAFENKYAAGLAVMPWTLASCVWFALLLVSQTYVWCAEKSHSAAWPMVVGLVVNISLNLLLLPLWGLLGAVVATAVAMFAALAFQLYMNHRNGMAIDRATLLLLLAPALLTTGPTIAALGTVFLLLLSTSRGWVLSAEEQTRLVALLRRKLGRFQWRKRRTA